MKFFEKYFKGSDIVVQGISFALVALIAFSAGFSMGGTNESVASVVTHMPFIGDRLDPTPNKSVNLTDFWKAWNTLQEKYVITHASSTLPTVQERMFGAISGLAKSYGDPYTVFFPPKKAKAFSDNISGSFAGVGMEISIKDKILTVVAPLKGTPAQVAGIKTGDQIIAINKKTTEGISIELAVQKIRGPVGTSVDLTIVRNGKPINIKITRSIIQVPEINDGLDKKSGVYHIALYEFTANSAEIFNKALERFRTSGSKKLIIDLRGNPGGYLNAAINIASHFLPKGTLVVTEDFGKKELNKKHTSFGYGGVPKNTKIVVLIDEGSASASEILAGALKDNHVATLIGTTSFGKGSVQTLVSLDGGLLKVTVARWITPDGHWIMGNGITPDIIVPYAPKGATKPPKIDPQMARAIKFLTNGK